MRIEFYHIELCDKSQLVGSKKIIVVEVGRLDLRRSALDECCERKLHDMFSSSHSHSLEDKT